jgi:hypothetical protein
LLIAASASAFQLHRTAVSGGAVDTSGGSYILRGTVGEAGGIVNRIGGGSFLMSQGFWFTPGGVIVSAEESLPVTPLVHAMAHAAPNPFRSGTVISYAVADDNPVRLQLFDVSGRRVRMLVDAPTTAGFHQVAWDGRDEQGRALSSGIYYARIQIGRWSETRKVLKLR